MGQERNREAWLTELAYNLEDLIQNTSGIMMPKYRISIGFPSRGALSTKQRVIGQCWDGFVSASGHSELFISPLLENPVDVAATVAHEMVHANVGCKHGHKAPFARVAFGIGLAGKVTSTHAGDTFKKYVDPILKSLGEYPHTAMVLNTGRKPQATNMLKVMCEECGYTIRTTRKWLDKGTPLCLCNSQPMSLKESK